MSAGRRAGEGLWRPLSRIAAALFMLILADAAHAADTGGGPAPRHQDEAGASHAAGPFSITLTYASDVNALLSGGLDRGSDYLGRLGIIGDVDLDQALGWRGAGAHISVHEIHGEGLSRKRVGNLLTASGIEAEPAFRLFNLWIEQSIGDRASVRVGQFTAGQEFSVSDTAALLINGTFGWPSSFGSDLPSGGPNYPLAAPGARLSFAPDPLTHVRFAVFAGDPAGHGEDDPQRRDRHGLNGLDFAGKPFVIAELQRALGRDPARLTVRVGGWAHLDRFDDVDMEVGDSASAPAGPRMPRLRHRGNFGLYASVDALLWRARSGSGRRLSGFVRTTFSPADRNLVDLYADGGLALTGPFRARPSDAICVGLAVARISPAIRARTRDEQVLSGTREPLPDFEAVGEVSYRLMFTRGIMLQPNVQYVAHPGARLPRTAGGGVAIPDALIVGLRTSARF